MIDYVILEGANGTTVQLDPNIYPLSLWDLQYDSRNDQTDKVQQHGQWQTYDYLGRVTLHVEGNILGNSPTDYWSNRLKFAQVFNPVSELGFKYTVNVRVQYTGVQEEVTGQFNLDGRPDIPINNQFPANSPFAVSLKAADPRMYGVPQSYSTGQPVAVGGLTYPLSYPLSYGSANTGGDAFLNNGGNANTYAQVVINGPVTMPTLTLDNPSDGTQTELAFTASGGLNIHDGDYVVVDMGQRTVVSSTGTNLFSYVSGTWWFLRPGSNHVRFNGLNTTPSTYAAFQWSNAYLF